MLNEIEIGHDEPLSCKFTNKFNILLQDLFCLDILIDTSFLTSDPCEVFLANELILNAFKFSKFT